MSVPPGSILIDGVRYLRPEGDEGVILRDDRIPATSRAAIGEGRYDSYQDEAYVAQFEFGGGFGQRRLFAGDQGLTGLADTRHGSIGPQWQLRGTAMSGALTVQYFFRIGLGLYGVMSNGQIMTVPGGAQIVSGFSGCRGVPKVSGNQAAFVNAGSSVLRYRATGTITNVTPPGSTSIQALASYGQYIWAFGRRSTPAGPTVIQQRSGQYSGNNKWTAVEVNWSQETREGNAGVVAFLYRKASTATGDGTPVDMQLTNLGWTVILATETTGSVTDDTVRGVVVAYRNKLSQAESGLRFEAASGQFFQHHSWSLFELDGMHESTDRMISYSASAADVASGTVTSFSSGAVSMPTSGSDFVLGGMMGSGGLDTPAGFTTISGASSSSARQGYRVTTDTTDEWSDSVITASQPVAFCIAMAGNYFDQAVSRWIAYYTSSDGESWEEVVTKIGTAPGTLHDTFTDGSGFLWITSNIGLYRMSYEEIPFLDGTSKINILLVGPLDHFDVSPAGYPLPGSQLVVHEQILFYNEGSTVRRFAPGGENNQIWPPDDWYTNIGPVMSMHAAEGGVYFTAGGRLYLYNRGFHILYKEATPGLLDAIYYHGGRLYVRDGRYFMLTNPSSRRELYTSPADWQTGWWISSLLDFDKPGLNKFLTEFISQVRFTAETESGSVKIYYANGCGTGPDPGFVGDEAASLDWQLLGEHTLSSTGVATFRRGQWLLDPLTHISCRAVWVRFEIIPGSLGWPITEGYTFNGAAISPVRKLITVPLTSFSGQTDLDGVTVVDAQADVDAFVNALELLRQNTAPFTVVFDAGTSSPASYLVIAGEQRDFVQERAAGTPAPQVARTMTFRELP